MAKFKVGDKVRCIGTSIRSLGGFSEGQDLSFGGSGWKLNETFIIARINTPDNGRFICWPDDGSGVWSSHLILDGPKEIRVYGIAKFCKENYK